MNIVRIAGVLVGLGLFASIASADLGRKAVPGKWLEEVTPEKLPPLKFPAYYNDFDKAKALAFAGRYKLAAMLLNKADQKKADPTQYALTKADILANRGQRQQAIEVLSAEKIVDKPAAQIARARILADLSRMDEAVAVIKKHLERYPNSLAGQYYLGEISEAAGDIFTARKAYEWIHENYMEKWLTNGAQGFDTAEDLVLLGKGLDRWATLSQTYQSEPALNGQILKCFTSAYDLLDVGYWPAHLAAAEFFLARDNDKDGTEELAAAAKGNPNDARIRSLIGGITLGKFDFDGCDKQIAAMRAVDEKSTAADLIECRSLLRQRRPNDAVRPVSRVLAAQPKNVEALGLMASCHALLIEEQQLKDRLAEVEKIDPDNATAYFEVAETLASMRQYPRAEAMYKIAVSRAPWWTAARNGLGLLYTQSGHEDLAMTTLEAAKSLDPFNYRTHNYLVLLDKMKGMARMETDNFIVIYDRDKDPLIPEYFNDYLESIHKEVCETYRATLPEKTLIEVFPNHDQFSVRTTGSPWIGTVGASTGRVIALVAPRQDKKTLGTYNWAQVLRHEFAHTVTLAATDNRITHWMTEGLAVMQEQTPLRWEWVPLLAGVVNNKALFGMEDLTWAFIRPKKPTDRTQAYAQSMWVCQYITEKWGHETILKMMDEFKAGKPQREVFPRLLGKSLTEFERDFTAWTNEQVKGWGYDADTTRKYTAAARAAQKLIEERKYPEAVKAWEECLKTRPMDKTPNERLAMLYDTDETRDNTKALSLLKGLADRSLKDNRYSKRIVSLSIEIGDMNQAQKYATQAIYIDPYDIEAHEAMVRVLEKTGDQPKLTRERRIVTMLEEWRKKAYEDLKAATTRPM